MIKFKNEENMLPFPRVVRIEPSAKCNLACSHCPTGTIDMVRGLMNEKIFEKTLEQVKKNIDYIKVVVLYHGGEPLLNKKFYQMASSVRNLSSKLLIKTVTNGMSLSERNISNLLSCGLNEIEISLDGISPTESEEVRVKSDTAKIVENLKNLIVARDNANLNLTISVATTQFLRSKLDVSKPEMLNVKTPSWLINLFGDSVNYKPTIAMKWPHMKVGEEYELVLADGQDKNQCDHTINTITVRSNGDIVPCCYDLTSQMVLGNVMEQPLFTIFNGSKYKELRTSIQNKDYISACQNCNTVRPNVYLIKPL
jgi:radical SAM protein with 4Fe4S-binding SPASM domain